MTRIVLRRALTVLFTLFALCGCVTKEAVKTAHFRAVGFDRLPGWQSDDAGAALAPFQRSCARLAQLKPATAIGPYGTAGDWQGPCAQALALTDPAAARGFFETNFTPFQVLAGREAEGLFTGYYEPELQGARLRGGRYTVPLLARPADLVSVELGQFRPSLKGQRIAGRVAAGGRLVPYPDRHGIEAEALGAPSPDRRALAWVDDPADAFFMEIQGSGRIRFEDGSAVRLGYDGQNGQPYTAIGRLLVERGTLNKDEAGMAGIRAWLAQNPEAGARLMDENASYVFFKELPVEDPALGPPGAQSVPLTPGRSLAVDLSVHGLGIPVFVAAGPAPDEPVLQRLMIAQDTGGAIVGPVRGDVFFGFGPEAGAKAGAMKARGTMFVLLPKALAGAFETKAR